MIIIKAKTMKRREELQAYRREFLRQLKADGVLFLPADFTVEYVGTSKQAVIVTDEEGMLCTD